eukprot:m.980403 g.980403  ORF g.980403 m.980403 type:complete len:160 (+) comp23967_c0_seq3:78-557(+)
MGSVLAKPVATDLSALFVIRACKYTCVEGMLLGPQMYELIADNKKDAAEWRTTIQQVNNEFESRHPEWESVLQSFYRSHTLGATRTPSIASTRSDPSGAEGGRLMHVRQNGNTQSSTTKRASSLRGPRKSSSPATTEGCNPNPDLYLQAAVALLLYLCE